MTYGDEQANEFLNKNDITITLNKGGNKKPSNWKRCGHGYRVLVKGNGKWFDFDYFDSIYNKENGLTPSNYDILACLSSDINCSPTWSEFCGDFGYEMTLNNKKIFKGVRKQSRKVNKFFTEEQLEELYEIQ